MSPSEPVVANPSGAGLTARPVPSPAARRLLLFEGLVLAEYWLAPLFFGLTNYAGVWSDIGILLFLLVGATLVVTVLLPLRPHLRTVMRTPRERLAFHGVWIAAFLLGLFVTFTFQLGGPDGGAAAVRFGTTTVYGPFGAWPSLTVFVPTLRLFGTLNVENLSILLLLSVLGSSALRLGTARSLRSCPAGETPAPTGLRRAVALVVWAPLGLVTGCTACAPLYLSFVGLFAPGVSASGLAAQPLVPWIGFAGFLYLASFGLALHLLHRATVPEVSAVDDRPEATTDG